ncbi:MAG: cytochrome-c peroxidase [Planctomycetes bacterium]|nr:cytochrome-c peroxidase [Planctomycetota bacterium]
MKISTIFFNGLVFILVAAAAPAQVELTAKEKGLALTLSPLPALPASPSNRYADNADAARFGQRLFFDPRLSKNGEIACFTCHQPDLGWSDGKTTAIGLETLNKHSPSLLNSGYQRWFFWDGRADSLWAQVQYPLENPAEMGYTRSSLVRLLASDYQLGQEYQAIFGNLPDGAKNPERFPDRARPPLPEAPGPFTAAPTPAQLAAKDDDFKAWFGMQAEDQKAANRVLANCAKAIAAYERLLVTGPSRFDRFVAALRDPDKSAAENAGPTANADQPDQILSAAEIRGYQLFAGKAGCINCHFSPMLSGGEFHNIGLEVATGQPFDSGRPDGIKTVRIDPMNGRGEFSDARDWEQNVKIRYLAYNKHTFGSYKTPTLRNVGLSAPYMHDGRFSTIREVLEFYRDLPGMPPVGHREETLLPIAFTAEEMIDLEAFLHSLTGTPLDKALTEAPVDQN